MNRRSTVVYIIILLALVGTYLYLKTREQPSTEIELTPEAIEAVNYLFTAEEGMPTSIRIEAKAGEVVEVARDAGNAWALILPVEAKADQGSSEAAASQVTTMRVLETVPSLDPKIAGLDDPDYTLTVKFNSGVERTVKIGVITPSESGYYVQDAAGGDVLIVSRSSVDALLNLLTFPPYLETPTPQPNQNVTPTP